MGPCHLHGLGINVQVCRRLLNIVLQLASELRVKKPSTGKQDLSFLKTFELSCVPLWFRGKGLCGRHVKIELFLKRQAELVKSRFAEKGQRHRSEGLLPSDTKG